MSLSPGVASAGIEFECGISDFQFRKVETFFGRWRLGSHILNGSDGSVLVEKPLSFTTDPKYRNWRPNAEIAFWSDKKIDLTHFLEYMNKAGARTNRSCGMHVHFKFDDMARAIAVFASCTVRNRFTEMYTKFANEQTGVFHERLIDRLHSRYAITGCDNTIVKQQLIASTHHDMSRYRQINLASLHRTHTIEVRILPGIEYPDNKTQVLWLIKTMSQLYNKGRNNKAVLKHYATLLYSISPQRITELPEWLKYDSQIHKYYDEVREAVTTRHTLSMVDVLREETSRRPVSS